MTTSESVLFELVGNAGWKGFKEVAGLVKQWKGETEGAVGGLCGVLYGGGALVRGGAEAAAEETGSKL